MQIGVSGLRSHLKYRKLRKLIGKVLVILGGFIDKIDSITTRNGVLHCKLIINQMVKKIIHRYGTQIFITEFTKDLQWTLSLFCEIYLNIILSSRPLSPNVSNFSRFSD